MTKSSTKTTFVVYVGSADAETDLQPMKLYQRLEAQPDDPANYWRVLDESGEDYLYPARYFVPISVPQKVKLSFTKQAM